MFTKDKGILDGNPFGDDTGTDADFSGPNDPGDEHIDKVKRTELDKWKRNRLVRFGGDTGTDADFKKEVDIINEQAEAEYRNTVLHPEYKSEYSEEE